MTSTYTCTACGAPHDRPTARYCSACAGQMYRDKRAENRRKHQGSGTWADWEEARAAYRRIVAARRQETEANA